MKTPQIPTDLWISNLLGAAQLIADKQYQESRWIAPDALAWETPDEVLNALDDCGLDGFIEQFSDSFSADQANAIACFRDEVDRYCKMSLRHLEPDQVLSDPRWELVRQKASAFIQAFHRTWPKK